MKYISRAESSKLLIDETANTIITPWWYNRGPKIFPGGNGKMHWEFHPKIGNFTIAMNYRDSGLSHSNNTCYWSKNLNISESDLQEVSRSAISPDFPWFVVTVNGLSVSTVVSINFPILRSTFQCKNSVLHRIQPRWTKLTSKPTVKYKSMWFFHSYSLFYYTVPAWFISQN